MTQDIDDVRGEAISQHIHEEFHAWMTDAAGTATNKDELASLIAGAIGGLAQFCWEIRDPGTDVERVALGFAVAFRGMVEQIAALDAPQGAA